MTTLLALLLTTALGVTMLRTAGGGWRLDLLVGAGFLCGSMAVALSMIALSGAGVSWAPLSIVAASVPVGACGMLLVRRAGSDGMDDVHERRFSWGDLAILAILTLHGLYVTESAPRTLDYWAIWGLKAKVFFAAGGAIDWIFLTDPTHDFAHTDYPLLVSLMQAWAASWDPVWSDRWFGLIDTAFLGSLVLVVRGTVATISGSVATASWTAAIAALPAMHWLYGIADLPLIAFVTSGLLCLQSHLLRDDRRHLVLGALLLGGGALTKNEGLTFLLLAIMAMALLTRRRQDVVFVGGVGLTLASVWQVPRLLLGLNTDVVSVGFMERLMPRLSSLAWLRTLVASTPPEIIATAIALVVASMTGRRWLRRLPLLIAIPFVQLFIYVLIYASTPHSPEWHIETSWPRISLHVAVPLLIAALIPLLTRSRGEAPQSPPENV